FSPSFSRPPPRPTLFPYTTLFRSVGQQRDQGGHVRLGRPRELEAAPPDDECVDHGPHCRQGSSPAVFGRLGPPDQVPLLRHARRDRKSTRLNSSHVKISYAVFCLK